MGYGQNKSIASAEWIEMQLVRIVETAMANDVFEIERSDTADDVARKQEASCRSLNLARLACMDLAKLKGYIVEKKAVARANIKLEGLTREQLREHLAGMMEELEPGARSEIRRLIASSTIGSLETSPTASPSGSSLARLLPRPSPTLK